MMAKSVGGNPAVSVALLLVILGLLASGRALATSVRVIDGDTIEVGAVTYRLHGIDAPEAGQRCEHASGKTWACGKASIALIESLVLGSVVQCDNRGTDGYGRVIGVCRADGVDINATMVRRGHAWAFSRYSTDYLGEERSARREAVGVFEAENETPWDYRAKKWQVGAEQAPDGCPIKGNISENGRIYHAPWSPFYSRTKISTSKGERWFCSEAEAVEAGWRAPRWGR